MTTRSPAPKPVVLIILDGWGIGRVEPGNAILAAATPTLDRLLANYPNATLRCSGEDVGLPAGQMGNSEVGHLNLGAGYIVYQWLTRLDRAVEDGTLQSNPTLLAAFDHAKQHEGTVHFLGLVSYGGVHSHENHLHALLRATVASSVDRIVVHAFTDGRDTSPTSGLASIERVDATLQELGTGQIGSVSGRYYAMDRDHRWDRIERAYRAIVLAEHPVAATAVDVVRRSYAAGITDEFIEPAALLGGDESSRPIQPGDSLVFFNFRADRMRQFVEALTNPSFDGFDRGDLVPNLYIATMASYEDKLPVHVMFDAEDVARPLAKAISDAGLSQLHVAETEKYAHVTFFINGGRESPFPGERRVLVPSPKVATYDLQPEMSAAGVASAVTEAIAGAVTDFIVVNLANCDMVGHTGVLQAAISAVETVDRCLGHIVNETLEHGGAALITADHGNAEEMIDRASGQPMTAHTTNPVPVILVAPDDSPWRHTTIRQDGRLSAIAPTVLDLLGVALPAAMAEKSLIDEQRD